jgi:plasmid stabilization system protein ParE
MYDLIVSELAHEDLDNIYTYIDEQLANHSAAESFLMEVEKYYSYLKKNPYIFPKCLSPGKEDYHKVMIKNYLILSKIIEEPKTVRVFRFFYCAQDYEKLL